MITVEGNVGAHDAEEKCPRSLKGDVVLISCATHYEPVKQQNNVSAQYLTKHTNLTHSCRLPLIDNSRSRIVR